MNPPSPVPNPMKLRTNGLRERYRVQGYLVGTFLEIPAPQIVELFGLAGFDFVVIDREHGAINLETTENLIRAAATTGISPLVRVSGCEAVTIRQPLDMGAAGIHVPQIESAEQARQAVSGAKFFPRGERGLQPYVRAASYRAYPTPEFLAGSNDESMIVLHIEGMKGVAAFDEILAVDGVDVAFLGPYDLSQSLGIPGMVGSPLVKDKMKELVQRAGGAEVPVGTYCDSVETALEWRALGVTYLAISVDASMLLQAARGVVSRLK